MENPGDSVRFRYDGSIAEAGAKSQEKSHQTAHKGIRLSYDNKGDSKGEKDAEEEDVAQLSPGCFNNWRLIVSPEDQGDKGRGKDPCKIT